MNIGYARVSLQDQDTSRQERSLKEAGCEKIFMEKISGAKRQRPELDRMLKELMPGDVVVVHKLDRLGRSLVHLLQLLEKFKEKQVGFKSLGDNIDLQTPAGKFMFNILGSVAEFERELIRERVAHGMKNAKANGVKLGKRPKYDEELVAKFKLASGSREQVMRELGISKHQYYYLKTHAV